MAFVAVLDANVFVNAAVRDTLLRAAERDLYRLALTERILEETRRALETNLGRTRDQTDYLLGRIHQSFEGSMIEGYEPLIPSMANPEDDRHVLAAAVRANAGTIVTFNIKHFPSAACAPYSIEAQRPGSFLLDLWDLAPDTMANILVRQAEALRHRSLEQLIDRLAKDAPEFADAVVGSGLVPFEG